jgi:hypothetical protein
VDRKRAIHHGGTERTEKNEFESVTYIELGEPDVGRPFTAFLFYWGSCLYLRFDPNLKQKRENSKLLRALRTSVVN